MIHLHSTCDKRRKRGSSCTWPSMRGVWRLLSGSLEAFLLSKTEAQTGSNIYWCSRLCIHLFICSCNRQMFVSIENRAIVPLNGLTFPKTYLYFCWGKVPIHTAFCVPVDTEFTDFQLFLSNKLLGLWLKRFPFNMWETEHFLKDSQRNKLSRQLTGSLVQFCADTFLIQTPKA